MDSQQGKSTPEEGKICVGSTLTAGAAGRKSFWRVGRAWLEQLVLRVPLGCCGCVGRGQRRGAQGLFQSFAPLSSSLSSHSLPSQAGASGRPRVQNRATGPTSDPEPTLALGCIQPLHPREFRGALCP